MRRLLVALAIMMAILVSVSPAANFLLPLLSGDISNSEPGSAILTIQSGAVSAAKLASGAAAGNLGYTPAHSGANADISALSGLTTALSPAQGGTGSTTGNISALSVTPTGATISLTTAAIAANTLLPAAYGVPANTKLSLPGGTYVTATAGSPTVTLTNFTFTSADIGKNIVISGLGPDVTQSAVVTAGGTGNAVGDVLTLSMSGCTTATNLTVTAVASGVVTAAVPTTNGSCAPASIPSNPVSVASTTGSGTGATFTLTYGAYSLATTIAGVTSATQITLAATSAQTRSAVSETVAYGLDDAAGINAAIATGNTSLTLAAGATYGITSPIVFSTTNRIKFDCNGSAIVALAPVAQMLYEATPSNFSATAGSSVQNCDLKGMGQATLNVSHNAFKWTYRDNFFEDVAPGGGNVYTAGSGQNTLFTGNEYRNNTNITGAYPLYNISNNYTDNHFVDEIGSYAVNGVVDNSSGTYYTGDHFYFTLASQFVINGSNEFFWGDYADGVPSYVAGFQLNGTYIRLIGWHATNPGAVATNPIGVYLATQNGYNTVALGDFQNITAANAIIKSWANYVGTTNVVGLNLNAQYSGVFGDSSFVSGYGAAYGAGDAIGIGPFATVTNGGIGVGTNTVANAPGSFSAGYNPGDNGSTWNSYSPSGGLSSTAGYAQHQLGVMEQTTSGSTAVRLTANASAAAKANCAWNPNNTSMAFDVKFTVQDRTTTGKHYAAFWTGHLYSKDVNAASTLIDGSASAISPDSTRIVGTWTGASASLSADTTNGCLNLSFTPPTGNTDALDIIAEIYGPQGQ